MQFKLEKCWWRKFFGVSAVVALFSAPGFAAFTVSGMTSAPITGTIINSISSPGTSQDYYVASSTIVSANSFIDSTHGYVTVDFTKNFASGSRSPADTLLFVVTNTDTAPASPNMLGLMVTAGSSNTAMPIPFCPGGATCAGAITQPNGYRSIQIPANSSIIVGLYLDDICAALAVTGSSPAVCGGGGVGHYIIPNTGTTIQPLVIQFNVGSISTLDQTTLPTSLTPPDSPQIVNIFPEGTTLGLTCAAADDTSFTHFYKPGDGNINVQPSIINPATAGAGPAGAPYATILAEGAPTASFVHTATVAYFSNPASGSMQNNNNSIIVQPIENSTNNNHIRYTVEFGVRDNAGMVILDGGGVGQCVYGNILTAQIFGFLNKSNCFIATAAFDSMNVAPVKMLRAFRDQFLLQHTIGKFFVHWYYAWSPEAAHWLIFHPEFRVPVLTALIPVEAIALAILHPFWAACFLFLGFLAMGFIIISSRQRRGRAC